MCSSNKRRVISIFSSNKEQLIEQLQSLRLELYREVEDKGSFTHPSVLSLSEAADELIMLLQTIDLDKKK